MTPANLQNRLSEGKQFRLVKYFAWASFIVLIIFSFPFSVFISRMAKDILLSSYEDYALVVGENVNHQVFQNFLFPIVLTGGEIRLSDSKQHEMLDRIVRNTIHGFDIDVVNIYDIAGEKIAYSTDQKLIGQKTVGNLGYRKAVNDETSSFLISGGRDIWGIGIELPRREWKLRTHIPMRSLNPLTGEKGIDPITGEKSEIIGILELLQDMTKQYEAIVKFQYFVFGLSSLIMILIFVALLFVVRKAEGIIEERAREQKELEEQLHLAERLAALGEMVAGVSHEIKNPLGIIRSTSELLGQMPDTTEAHKKLSNVITEESERLNTIVTEFLDFARPPELNLHKCRLEEIILKNLEFLSPELEKRDIRITHNLDKRSFNLMADKDLLYRAFLNIFINAMQAINGSGSINVRIEEEKGIYRVEIRDSGSGIVSENLKKIFHPFFTTKEKGTGLGLPIVRKIIEGHRGTVWIDSGDAKGTCVTVTLRQRP